MAEQSFWDTVGPGLLQTGGNIYLRQKAAQEAEDRLRRAQGPLYNQTQDLAGQTLNLAQGMDPAKMAADRFAQQQAILEPGMQADQLALFRQLQAKGLLNAASFAPVAGTLNTTGGPMNPQMAALFAAQQGAKSQAAYQSLGEGQQYLNDLLQRSGMLQGQGQRAQATGQTAMGQIPAKPSIAAQIVGGGMDILKDPSARSAVWNAVKKIPGMLGSAGDWLGEISMPDFGTYSGAVTPFYDSSSLSDLWL